MLLVQQHLQSAQMVAPWSLLPPAPSFTQSCRQAQCETIHQTGLWCCDQSKRQQTAHLFGINLVYSYHWHTVAKHVPIIFTNNMHSSITTLRTPWSIAILSRPQRAQCTQLPIKTHLFQLNITDHFKKHLRLFLSFIPVLSIFCWCTCFMTVRNCTPIWVKYDTTHFLAVLV